MKQIHRFPLFAVIPALLLLFVGVGASDVRAAAIERVPALKGWALSTKSNTYILGLNKDNGVQHIYWGGLLPEVTSLTPQTFPLAFAWNQSSRGYQGIRNEEFPGWQGRLLEEPCLKVTSANGVRDLILRYVSDEIKENALSIRLKDKNHDIFVTIGYRVYPDVGIIEKQATITNRTKAPITVESFQSGVWNLPPDLDYRLTYLAGHWAGEAHVYREMIQPGTKELQSRSGRTGFESNPWFAIDAGGEATEENGRVWFGALAWSGNWRLAVERTPLAQVRVTGGMHPFDFSYVLQPGESLEAPSFYGGYTENGFGGASRQLHEFQLKEIVPNGLEARVRPVWFNSYQIYGREVNEANQMALAKKAADVGVELFLVDAGWYSTNGDVNAGLGDWEVDRVKFPNGLRPLADYVRSLGMDFGLWIEPEVINPNSNLYRAHPDWVLNFEGRDLVSHGPGLRLPLNLGRDDVADYLIQKMSDLVTDCGVKLFKWDMNFLVGAPGWLGLPPEQQQQVWVKYTRNLYRIIDEVRARHPGVEFESCAGGGSRIDLGILKRVDQFWTSDNTDSLDRIGIQQGFSFAYAPRVLMGRVPPPASSTGYVNLRPDTSIDFRFVVAMTESLGLSLDFNKLTDEELARVKELVAFYKTIRPTVQNGTLFRLTEPEDPGLVAFQFVSRDEKQVVLFVMQRSRELYSIFSQPIHLRGLDAKAQYRMSVLHPKKMLEQGERVSGAWLGGHGLHFKFPSQSLDGTVVVLDRVE